MCYFAMQTDIFSSVDSAYIIAHFKVLEQPYTVFLIV